MPVHVWISGFSGPWGPMWICSSKKGVCGISLRGAREKLERELVRRKDCEFRVDQAANRDVMDQIEEYLEGKRRSFETQLDLWGTGFQMKVWNLLREIPYGHKSSYGELARSLGLPGAARAVGGAAGSNPVPLLVPCHRLVRGNGSLGGFGCGLDIKEFLLALEARVWGSWTEL
ncbi:MAG: methylated-DNA--[protein]-cysteine S-methyltransferase [bacterium]